MIALMMSLSEKSANLGLRPVSHSCSNCACEIDQIDSSWWWPSGGSSTTRTHHSNCYALVPRLAPAARWSDVSIRWVFLWFCLSWSFSRRERAMRLSKSTRFGPFILKSATAA